MVETEGRITRVKDETHDVKTFVIDVMNKIDFVPGQYCMVSMPGNKDLENEWRPFTFVNIPEDEYVELTVKRMGAFTTAMHHMEEGDKLTLKGPYGKQLNFDESVKDDVVFVAGGSGITPFFSAMKFAENRKMPNKILLLYSNKTENDIIFRDELEALNETANITVILSLTKEIPESWKGIRGRVTSDTIVTYVDEPTEKVWYVCGPPPMVESLKDILGNMGVPQERLRIEHWELPGRE